MNPFRTKSLAILSIFPKIQTHLASLVSENWDKNSWANIELVIWTIPAQSAIHLTRILNILMLKDLMKKGND